MSRICERVQGKGVTMSNSLRLRPPHRSISMLISGHCEPHFSSYLAYLMELPCWAKVLLQHYVPRHSEYSNTIPKRLSTRDYTLLDNQFIRFALRFPLDA